MDAKITYEKWSEEVSKLLNQQGHNVADLLAEFDYDVMRELYDEGETIARAAEIIDSTPYSDDEDEEEFEELEEEYADEADDDFEE